MTSEPRLACFVNVGASVGTGLRRLRAALRHAPSLRERCDIVTVHSRDEMRSVVARLPAGSIPVAAGGDGTVNWLCASLDEAGIRDRCLAVLPLGTGNALAYSLGMGRIRVALNALVSGEVRAIDMMRTTHPQAPVALISLSVGFESRLLRGVAAARSWKRVMTGALELPAAMAKPWSQCTFTVDGERLVDPKVPVYNAGLYSMPCYALGRVVNPEADPGDGLAEAVVCCTPRAYWNRVIKGVRMTDPPSDVRARRFRVATIESPEPFQIDGDSVQGGAIEVTVERRAVRIMVPRQPSRPKG